jgi:hypothetical protein
MRRESERRERALGKPSCKMCGRITQIVQLVMIAVGGCGCLKRNCRSYKEKDSEE